MGPKAPGSALTEESLRLIFNKSLKLRLFAGLAPVSDPTAAKHSTTAPLVSKGLLSLLPREQSGPVRANEPSR